MAIRNENITGATTNWEDGEVLFSNDLLDTTNGMLNAGVPLGSVTAWLKSFDNTPSLPTNWVECNGQVLSDAESVYNGKTIPNLNGASSQTKRFLRGSSSSGATGGSENHNHKVAEYVSSAPGVVYKWESASTGSSGNHRLHSPSGVPTSINTSNRDENTYSGNTDTKPPYYEVVWIMRIK